MKNFKLPYKNFKLPYKNFKVTSSFKIFIGILNFVFFIIAAEISSNILNLASNGNTKNLLITAILFLISIMLFQFIMLILNNKQSILEERQSQLFRMELYEAFISQKISIINKLGIGGVKERLTTDMENATSLMTSIFPSIAIGLISGLGYMFYMGCINLSLAIILFIISFAQLIPPFVVKKFLVKNYEVTAMVGEEWMNFIVSGNAGLSTIKLNNLKKWYIDKLNKINTKNVLAYKNTFKTVSQEMALNNMITSILTYGSYMLIGFFVFKKSISIEEAIKIIVICSSFYQITNNLFSSVSKIFIVRTAHNRLLSFIPSKNNKKVEFSLSDYIVEFEDVTFAYEKTKILDKINLKIPKHHSLAISGENAAGKSTLLKLLLKFEKEYEGTIKFMNRDIKEVKESDLYELISYIPQEDPILNMTVDELFQLVSNNLKFTHLQFNELVEILNFDYNSLKSKFLSELSGGERKKVSLIVGLSKDAELYILDEPTNSLDAQSQENLINLIKSVNKTFIIISHNNTLLDMCDYNFNITEKIHPTKELGGELCAQEII